MKANNFETPLRLACEQALPLKGLVTSQLLLTSYQALQRKSLLAGYA